MVLMCNRLGRACQEEFLKVFQKMKVSIKSENFKIWCFLRKVRDFWCVMRICEKMAKNRVYYCFQKSKGIFMT